MVYDALQMRFLRDRERGKIACLGIIGILFLIGIVAAIIMPMFAKHEQSKPKAIQRIEQKKEFEKLAAQQHKKSEFFVANSDSILRNLRLLLKDKKYSAVIEEAKQYLHVNDEELTQIHNKALEMDLFAKVKQVPARELETNQKIYAELMRLNPNEKLYKKKHQHYTKKIKERKKRRISKMYTVIFFFGIVFVAIGQFLTLTGLYSVNRFLGLIIRQEKTLKKIANSLPFVHSTFPSIPFEKAGEKLRLGDYLVLGLLTIPIIYVGTKILTTGISFGEPFELIDIAPPFSVSQCVSQRELDSIIWAFFQTFFLLAFIWSYCAIVVTGLSRLVLWIIFGSNQKAPNRNYQTARERRVAGFGFGILLLGLFLSLIAYICDKYLS